MVLSRYRHQRVRRAPSGEPYETSMALHPQTPRQFFAGEHDKELRMDVFLGTTQSTWCG